MKLLGVVMVIIVHVTTPFLRPFLFGTIFFFAHTCLPRFLRKHVLDRDC